jgi:hypothetical protein
MLINAVMIAARTAPEMTAASSRPTVDAEADHAGGAGDGASCSSNTWILTLISFCGSPVASDSS